MRLMNYIITQNILWLWIHFFNERMWFNNLAVKDWLFFHILKINNSNNNNAVITSKV